MERSVPDFEGTRQQKGEDKNYYARRLKRKAAICGNVYSDEELVTRYLLGLQGNKKPIILAERRKYLDDLFRDLVESAMAAGEAHRASQGIQKPLISKKKIHDALAVEQSAVGDD